MFNFYDSIVINLKRTILAEQFKEEEEDTKTSIT